MTKILPGPASVELGNKLAEELGVKTVPVEAKSFSDGESYIRISGDVENEKVVVVQSTYPPQNTHLVQLLQLLDAARDMKASEVIAVVPYLAYSRQDKRFRPGEAVSVGTIIRLIEATGVNSLFTVDVHTEKILELFRIHAHNVSATPALGEYFAKLGLKEPYVFAPDEGALARAKSLAGCLNADYSSFQKQRDRVSGAIKTSVKEFEVKDRDAIIVDDIISTGSTIANAASMLHDQNARRIYVACTHPLLLSGAKDRMMSAGVHEIVGTDCVASEVSRVSVASVVAQSLRKTM